MATQSSTFTAIADVVLDNVRQLLDSSDASTRVRGVHHLAAAVEVLERQVLLDAQSSGLSWAQIGDIYGVSRQAVHRRFSDETVVLPDFFHQVLQDNEDGTEAVPTRARAANRVRRTANA